MSLSIMTSTVPRSFDDKRPRMVDGSQRPLPPGLGQGGDAPMFENRIEVLGVERTGLVRAMADRPTSPNGSAATNVLMASSASSQSR